MASFFQAPLATPPDVASGPWSLILSNTALEVSTITGEWPHLLVLAIGTSAIVLGGILQIVPRLSWHWQPHRWAKSTCSLISQWIHSWLKLVTFQLRLAKDERLRDSVGSYSSLDDLSSCFDHVQSFCVDIWGGQEHCRMPDCAMHVIALANDNNWGSASDDPKTVEHVVEASTPSEKSRRSLILGSVSPLGSDLALYELSDAEALAQSISKQLLVKGCDGLVLRHSRGESTGRVSDLLRKLRQRLIPVILQADADCQIWDDLDFRLIDGVLLQNACVLPDGHRRDFFRASRVRICAAQCKQERSSRPGFFFGFLETWSTRPSAAVIRRAYMLGDFFGAVVQVRPEQASDESEAVKETPISGFDWLKLSNVAWLQQAWSSHAEFGHAEERGTTCFDLNLSSIAKAIPAASHLLSSHLVEPASVLSTEEQPEVIPAPEYVVGAPKRPNIWDFASCGARLCSSGCFSLREEITDEQYNQVVKIQRSLKENRLLQLYGDAENLRVAESLKTVCASSSFIDQLHQLLQQLADGSVRIFMGLDSGFTLPDEGGHLWAVSDASQAEDETTLDLHISLKASNDVAAIWHAFLAHCGVSRLHRFEEELLLRSASDTSSSFTLPLSISKELEDSSEAELLYLVEQVRVSEEQHAFNEAILKKARQLLIEDTSIQAWKARHSKACIDDFSSIRSLLEERLRFHSRASKLPTVDNLVSFYGLLEQTLDTALLQCDRDTLNMLTNPVLETYGHAGQEQKVTPFADIYGLLFFCALRKLAFENVYLETTDRCPLFLSQPDQAGVFAELWVLGSQCEMYFGILPRALGDIIYNKYCQHLSRNPPPVDSWGGKDVFTAYSTPAPRVSQPVQTILSGSGSGMIPEGETTEKPMKASPGPPKYARAVREVGALSIFCFPAIMDVALLTFLGRGLYLTAFMDDEVKRMADYAILTALVMTGGVTGWVGSTGGFYLFNCAYDNMTHFLVQRFSAAMMLTSVVAFAGFIAFGVQYSWFAGLMRLCHEWTDWHIKVPNFKEKDLLAWYRKHASVDSDADATSLASAARCVLQQEINRVQRQKRSWALWNRSKDTDTFVMKMANGMNYADFLLRKDASAGEPPELFTTTWFVQLELALDNQRQLMRGLKEHSSFINYRYSRYDLGQNVGLFLAALLDRLVAVVMSARGHEPTAFNNPRNRYAICFALLHFLGGALAVDVVLQRCWGTISVMSTEKLGGVDDLDRVLASDEKKRFAQYKKALFELMGLLFVIFGSCTVLLWFLVVDYQSIILFFTYTTSYTAVLLCQYHRCFTKSHRLHVITVLCCCSVGFVLGCVLRAVPATATFPYDFVIAQNVATISAVICTGLLTTRSFNKMNKAKASKAAMPTKHGQPSSSFDAPTTQDAGVVVVETKPSADIHETNRILLTHLCLGLDVNATWLTLPQDVRRLILHRVIGKPSSMTATTRSWLDKQQSTIALHDIELSKCISYQEIGLCSTQERHSSHAHINSTPANISSELTSDLSQMTVRRTSALRRVAQATAHAVDVTVQWTAIISGAAPDAPRELWYAVPCGAIGSALLWLLLIAWKICWCSRRFCTWAFLLAGKQPAGTMLDLVDHGSRRTLRGHIVTVDTPSRKLTGFILRGHRSDLGVIIYDGLHTKTPQQKRPLAVAFYDASHRLCRREEVHDPAAKPAETLYTYDDKISARWPVSKTTFVDGQSLATRYDRHGRPTSGQIVRSGLTFDFEYSYNRLVDESSDVVFATYKSTSDTISVVVTVFWCVRSRNRSNRVGDWVPSEKVQMVYASFGEQTYEVRWVYKHAQDANIEASVIDANGKRRPCLPPSSVMDDKYGLLKRPQHVSFDNEDLLIYHPPSSLKKLARSEFDLASTVFGSSRVLRRLGLGEKVVHHRLPTSTLRTALWKSWQSAPYIDAAAACFLDEMILRKEPLLQCYWRFRDAGLLRRAAHELDESLEQIVSAIEPTFEASSKCPLLIKSADLYTMGLGKDANQLTARLEDAYRDTATTTSVIFSDNGCWPDNPGGVSNCRRDLVNGHTTIRGHCLAESANDFGIPRYQIERNINSLKILPLWGMDGKTPYHGIFDNLLQGQVEQKCTDTRVHEDIEQVFIPLLHSFVHGARSKRYSRNDLVTYSNVMLQLHRYFETCDFIKTWNSEQVWRAWLEAWLVDYEDPNVLSLRECFDIEHPSLSDFRDALNLYICYFFIYSVGLPADCPTVFQTTHHGLSSLYGMTLKYRKGVTWGLWDHAILWRETCLNISPAQCLLPLPVQSMLIAGIKLACHLAYTHVDIILPCTSVFNPDWEQDLGTDQGLRGSKKAFARRIDPIVNGISNMDTFQPIAETRSKLPTTVMLSNVQFIKDVKTAVRAADVIINKYGFKDYRLVIYGAQDRQPSYALETVNLINSRGMAGKVILAGFGSPKEVLKDAWLFLNSSLSEGLPLAIGEAALSGVPIVATEVGATALVLTDPDDIKKRYGEVVPPNDPESLARAQLSVLAMMGSWAQHTQSGESAPLPDTFSTEDVERITKRMYEKAGDRRMLGLKLREVVLRSFHGHRYLREHEQMYWIQRRRAEIRRSAIKPQCHPPASEAFGGKMLFKYHDDASTSGMVKARWQDFDKLKLQQRGQVEDARNLETV
ncbi:glycosyltransferase family 4 protein [Hortaea werneckii]|nr:glycosyltransferase family 4 protein [Hortaea werneckii]